VGHGQREHGVRLRELSAPDAQLLHHVTAFGLQHRGVDGLLVAPRRLGLLRLLQRELAQPAGEAGQAQAVFPGAAHTAIHAGQGAHNCREGGWGERGGSTVHIAMNYMG